MTGVRSHQTREDFVSFTDAVFQILGRLAVEDLEVQVTISTPLGDLRIAGKEMLDVLVGSGTDPGDEFDLQIIREARPALENSRSLTREGRIQFRCVEEHGNFPQF